MKTVVLFSGGLDSRICLHWAMRQSQDVEALTVNFGHRYAHLEAARVLEITTRLGIKLNWMSLPLGAIEREDAYIPLRNLYLLELATNFGDNIVFGMLHSERPPDKNPRFCRQMEALLTSQFQSKEYDEQSRQIRIITPFAYCTKTEMLRWFLKSPEDREAEARATVSCHSADGKCGRCTSCLGRWVAFVNNRLEPEEFRYPPYEWAMESLLQGKKRRQRILSPSLLWGKRKYILELIQAFRTVVDSPVEVAIQVLQQQSIEPFRRALDAASD